MNEEKRRTRDEELPEDAENDLKGHSAGDDEEDQNVYIVPNTGG